MAIAALVVLGVLDSRLKAATGFGVVDLQGMSDAMGYKRTLAAWIAREHSVSAGFSLGFDYLFMPLYAISFYFSAMIAREAFTPKKGVYRRVMDYLGYVPFVGAIADAPKILNICSWPATDSFGRLPGQQHQDLRFYVAALPRGRRRHAVVAEEGRQTL